MTTNIIRIKTEDVVRYYLSKSTVRKSFNFLKKKIELSKKPVLIARPFLDTKYSAIEDSIQLQFIIYSKQL